MRVLTRAEVCVRVYDGKVSRWHGEYVPLTITPAAPVTKEQAQKAAADSLVAGNSQQVDVWLEAVPEVLATPAGQRCVWTLLAGTWSRTGKHDWRVDFFFSWHVDAATGEVVDREVLRPTRELFARYQKLGGTRHPEGFNAAVEQGFVDTFPAIAPDGKRVAFVSNRPRPGYPYVVQKRPYGVFIANLDGSGLACVCPTEASYPAWAPDSRRLAFGQGDGITVLDLNDGTRVRLHVGGQWRCQRLAWMRDGKLVAVVSQWGPFRLLLFDPMKPETVPAELHVTAGAGQTPHGLTVDGQGRLLFAMHTDMRMANSSDGRRRD